MEGALETTIVAAIAGSIAALGIFGIGYAFALLGIGFKIGIVTGASLAAGAAANTVTNSLTKGATGKKRTAAACLGLGVSLVAGLLMATILVEALLIPASISTVAQIVGSTAAPSVTEWGGTQLGRIIIKEAYPTIGAALTGSYMGRNTASLIDPSVNKEIKKSINPN